MAPNCINASAVFGPGGEMTALLNNAMALLAKVSPEARAFVRIRLMRLV